MLNFTFTTTVSFFQSEFFILHVYSNFGKVNKYNGVFVTVVNVIKISKEHYYLTSNPLATTDTINWTVFIWCLFLLNSLGLDLLITVFISLETKKVTDTRVSNRTLFYTKSVYRLYSNTFRLLITLLVFSV